MVKFPIENIASLFSTIADNCDLFLPQKDGKGVNFKKYTPECEYDLDTISTTKSPKSCFFPQIEEIAKFKIEKGKIDIIENDTKSDSFVIFGVRACDVKSFDILDRVFLSEPLDPFYKERRENGIVISLACNKPNETCFCCVFDINPAEPMGDISAYINDGFIYFKGITKKGKEYLDSLNVSFIPCNEKELNALKDSITAINSKLPLSNLDLSYWKNTDEKTIFNSSKWDEIYKGCLGCGSCTFVCPTCQCYDVAEFTNGNVAEKYRCWDSCMYSDFTKMAHGNPRKSQKERFRQRFMHKLKYFPENNNAIYSCVGCGRCVRSCPQGKNIVKTARSVSDD